MNSTGKHIDNITTTRLISTTGKSDSFKVTVLFQLEDTCGRFLSDYNAVATAESASLRLLLLLLLLLWQWLLHLRFAAGAARGAEFSHRLV